MNNVPWKELFGVSSWQMTRDSTARKNHRHYRAVLDLPHSRFKEVSDKLSPYGFTVTKVNSERGKQQLKAIRQTPLRGP